MKYRGGVNWDQLLLSKAEQVYRICWNFDFHLNQMTAPIFQPSFLHADGSQPASKSLKSLKIKSTKWDLTQLKTFETSSESVGHQKAERKNQTTASFKIYETLCEKSRKPQLGTHCCQYCYQCLICHKLKKKVEKSWEKVKKMLRKLRKSWEQAEKKV